MAPKRISQIVLLCALIIGCLLLYVPAAAMKSWSIVHVPDPLGGTLRLAMPAGAKHFIDEDTGFLAFGTNEDVIDTTNTAPLPPGQWSIGIGAIPVNLIENLTPQRVLDAFEIEVNSSIKSVLFRAPETLAIEGHPAALVRGSSSQGDVLVLVVDVGNAYLVMTGITARGEQALLEPTLFVVIESAEYRP